MSKTTPNLGLHKYDPASDGNLYFDIETGINGPLDIIDQRLGGEMVERAPMSFEIQPGVGIYNASRKSRLKNLSMTGRTLVNLLGRAGNCEDISKWAPSQSTIASDSSNFSTGANGMKITISASYTKGNAYTLSSFTFTAGKYYVLVADVKNGNATSVTAFAGGSTATKGAGVSSSDTTKFAPVWRAYNPSTTTSSTVSIEVTGTAGQYGYGDAVRVYEISSVEYAALDSMTADQIAAKYPYVDEAKHVNAVYLRNPGKNLLPPFTDWNQPSSSAVYNATDAYSLSFSGNGSSNVSLGVTIPVVAGQTYTITVNSGGNGKIGLNAYDKFGASLDSVAGNPFGVFSKADSLTFTTPVGTVSIKVSLYRDGTITEPLVFINPMLNIGSTALPFEPQKPSYLYLPDCNLRASVDGSISDKLYMDGEGKPRAVRRFKEMVIDGALNVTWAVDSYTGFKRVKFAAAGVIGSYVYSARAVIKYDGKIIPESDTTGGADRQALSGDGNFYLTISSTDSGWGDAYTPTADEIKAYFWGWRMYNSASGNAVNPYTGASGETKGWVQLPQLGNPVTTVPATYPTAVQSQPYTPYRLIYQLAQSVDEPINYEGNLMLHDGSNQVELGTGVIMREANSPGLYNGQYYLNDTSLGSALKNRVASLWNIYRNQQADSAWTKYSGGNQYGNMKANIATAIFDPSAAYSVTYLALDTYLLGFAPDSIQAEYVPNIKEAVDSLTRDMTEARTALSVLQNTKAQKQQPQWIAPTLLNGWVNYGDGSSANYSNASYYKDSEGIVRIKGIVKSGTINSPIFYLPVGYRPKGNRSFIIPSNSGTTDTPGRLVIAYDGSVFLINLGTNTFVYLDCSFLAEQ